jgi:hypothetical protein
MISRRSILLTTVAAVAPSIPAFSQSNWKTYKNERFGATIMYPSNLFQQTEPPANNDGRRFVANDGAEFISSGIRNVLEESLAEIEASAADSYTGAKLTYRDRGKDWFVVSGTQEDKIFYRRSILSHRKEILNTFVISYPAGLKSTYDPIVARMSRSFKAGTGYDSGRP